MPAPAAASHNWTYLIATFVIIFVAYIHSSAIGARDPYRCNAALLTGQWLDSPGTGRSISPFQKWQPDGCILRNYNKKSVPACFSAGDGQDAVFIGDSTVREVFWATARKLDPTKAIAESATVEKHADVQFQYGKTTLSFKWDPFLNSSALPDYLRASRAALEAPAQDVLSESTLSRALVVVGGGLWFARNGANALEDFKSAMDKIALPRQPPFHAIADYPGENRVFFLPVQTPFYEHLDEDHKATLKPEDIDQMNAYMKDLPTLYGVDTVLSFLEMGQGIPEAYQPNGLHVVRSVADTQAEILLNIRCNNYHREYPFDGTCCYDYPLHLGPSIVMLIGFVCLGVVTWIDLCDWVGADSTPLFEKARKYLPFLRPCLVMWAALCYCFITDRTHVFEKIAKQYNNQDFFVFMLGITLAGLLTIRSSSVPKANQEKASVQDQPVLSRDQTDEWKGWMQAIILAYHYTGASKVLGIYKIVRLLVASYLFMTGYGHAAYFYQKNDFSLKRVVAVNLRINLLSCLLPWIMSTDYIFYYFAPLVTYWYAVVYITMRIRSDWNQRLPFFLGKVAVAAACTTLLHTQAPLVDPLFRLVNSVFGSQWEAREWMFRCALDQYIVYIGMIVSVMYIRLTKPQSPPPPPQGSFGTTAHTRTHTLLNFRFRPFYVYPVAAIFLAVYGWASSTRHTKTSSNRLHTYISPLAVLAFIMLRNATRALRNNYSGAFAWLGKISLETFILQYHLWLAADTKGLLSIGVFGDGGMTAPGSWAGNGMGLGRWVNCALLGVVFVWVSSKVAAASGGITSFMLKAIFG